jgi:hypothetical protein
MPSVQRGQVFKLDGGSWAFRYYDEHGTRHQRGGFQTRTEAAAKLEHTLARFVLARSSAASSPFASSSTSSWPSTSARATRCGS